MSVGRTSACITILLAVEVPLVTKKLPAVPLCSVVDYDYALVDSNPNKTDVSNVGAQSIPDKSKTSRKSILSKYGA